MCFIGGEDVKVDFYSTVDPWLDGSVVCVCVCVCVSRLPAFVRCFWI